MKKLISCFSDNQREPPSNSKLRNDNNVATYVKSERSSTSERRDSTKENSEPRALKKTSTIKSDRSKRSESVEIIGASKIVEIDMTKDDDVDKMPPPSMPITKTKSKRINKSKQTKDDKSDGENSIILPQSEIKKEKVSIETTITNQTQIISESGSSTFSATMIQQSTICETTTVKGKKGKKKYPMPMLVKMEPDEVPKIAEVAKSSSASNEHLINETFDVQKAQPNQTVTLASGAMNETVTLETNVEKKSSDRNLHDSLMTEDNDDEDAEEENAASATFAIPEIRDEPPPLPPKKKHNEVFNPYIASPVKQKIQAFEKRANQVATPEKYKTMPSKFMTLKAGTPSKIALFSGKTTPVSSTMTRAQKFASCSTLPSSLVKKTSKSTTKKAGSISQDTLDAESKKPTGQVIALSHQQLLEEKKKAREEKQRLAQLQREAIEKEKREVALRLQLEREEKHRKALREKEERLRIEAHKKKLKKEQQTVKKFIEKERQEDEAKAARDNDVHLNATAQMNDSLLVKLQKQKVEAHKQKMKNEENKNTYSFDMLQTDDSTDDEAQPSAKRPPPPSWSKSKFIHISFSLSLKLNIHYYFRIKS